MTQANSANSLRINEIYASIQGEGTRAGLPFVFIRMTGCSLRCSWCDTAYAFYEGASQSLDEVLATVLAFGIPDVLLTGGEPLEQPASFSLAAALCQAGCRVAVETGGHVSIAGLPEEVVRIVDIKAPGSLMAHRNNWNNVKELRPHDELKFVIANRADFDDAIACIAEHGLAEKVEALLFSPVHGALAASELVDWLMAEKIPGARLNLQLHKYVWPEAKRGV